VENSKHCPYCGNIDPKYIRFLAHGVVAPWIIDLLNKNPRFPQFTKLLNCKKCHLKFFSLRYEPKEMEVIYGNYRGDQYFYTRNKWEPWYSRKLNDKYKSSLGVKQRKYQMEELCKDIAEIENKGINLEAVLDYGGDLGQFFPDQAKRKILVEYGGGHGRPTRIGIERVRESEIATLFGSIDLVMATMVLEHVNDVSDLNKKFFKLIRPGGYLLLEVPLDSFQVSGFHRTVLYKHFISLLMRRKFLFILFDFLSGVFRNYFHKVPTFGIVKQSEHINYFEHRTFGDLTRGGVHCDSEHRAGKR